MPDVFFALAPELAELALPVEARATCESCRMRPREGEPEEVPTFAPNMGCCTYHPRLPNFLLGRELALDGEGAERIRARLRDGDGANAYGIAPPSGWQDEYAAGRRRQAFGQADFVRCPYLENPTADTLHCTVWKNRGAVCRTWFCAHEDGPAGAAMWRQAKTVMLEVERTVANWCLTQPGAPPEDAGPEELEAWYLRCAELVDAAPLEEFGSDSLEAKRDGLLATWGELEAEEVPEVLASCLSHWFVGDEVIVYGYSAYDAVRVPKSLWQFLSRLDGHTPWRAAAEASDFPEADARDLFRIAALEAPTSAHFGELEGVRMRMKTDGGEWIDLEPE